MKNFELTDKFPAEGGRKKMKEVMKIRSYTAVAMLASGVGLSIAGFIAPPFGEISDSVLWFFAQCLIYAGTALGFDVMIETKLRSLSKE